VRLHRRRPARLLVISIRRIERLAKRNSLARVPEQRPLQVAPSPLSLSSEPLAGIGVRGAGAWQPARAGRAAHASARSARSRAPTTAAAANRQNLSRPGLPHTASPPSGAALGALQSRAQLHPAGTLVETSERGQNDYQARSPATGGDDQPGARPCVASQPRAVSKRRPARASIGASLSRARMPLGRSVVSKATWSGDRA
jgi:hypothetical protein